jgi:hypothetical protein
MVGLGACSRESEAPADLTVDSGDQTEGFTFLGLGRSSLYSSNLREKLRQRLGHDVAERTMPLRLAIDPPGFVEQNLPGIARLDKRLNYAAWERIEQNIIRLTYRYAIKKGTPFKRVELVFSQYSDKPLMFYIQSGKSGGEMVATIKEKYGAYSEKPDDKREVTTLYWTRDDDVMAVTIGTDRFGDPEYHIWIFYGANLAELAATEEKKRGVRQQNMDKVGKEVF